jgi:hypothetical protein
MKYLHFYLKIIVPTLCICGLLYAFAECLKHGQHALAVASLVTALSQFIKLYFEYHDQMPTDLQEQHAHHEDAE